jgi:serine protease Do
MMQEPVFPPATPERGVRPAPSPSNNLPTLLLGLLLVSAVWLLPQLVEKLEFAYIRGRERAQVEVAREQLDSQPPMTFAQTSEQVAKSIGPSVVHIDIDTVQGFASGEDEMAQLLFGGRQRHEIAQGSGVIIDAEGYILTNNHVVSGASAMTVSLSDRRKVSAELIGGDPLTDLAVIKIDAEGLIPAPWGDSDKLPVGAPVWAVGNPYSLDRSVTFGIISAKSRRGIGAAAYQEFLQTDAAVNPGNSGGPLVDCTGKVVGINTAIVGPAYRGISFAIPSETVREVYEKLRHSEPILRGYLGVQLDELTPQIAKQLGLKDLRGAVVTDVRPGGPAEQAGIKPGDVIVKWNEQPVEDRTALQFLIAGSEVGSNVECTIIRDGQAQTKKVHVAEHPVQPTQPQRVQTR